MRRVLGFSGCLLAACSLLAPSDEELGGGGLGGSGADGGTTSAGGEATGAGGEGGEGGGESVCPPGYADGDQDPDNGCTEVPAEGLKFWYAADDTAPSPTGLQQWVDRSAANRDAFQGDEESRPTVVLDALAGLPVVRFDGIDDNLGVNGSFADLRAGITFATVARRADGMGDGFDYATLLDLKDSLSNQGRFFSRYWTNDQAVYGISGPVGSQTPSSPGTFPADEPVLIVVIHEASEARVRVCDDEAVGVVDNPGSVIHDSISIGTNRGDPVRNLTGDIAEMLFYRRALDEADLALLEAYLIDKWGVCP